MLFLPHSNRRTFLEDPKIYEILKDWISQMPLVKSAIEIPLCCLSTQTENRDYRWGLMVSASQAQIIGLPVNQAVRVLPGRQLFQFFFKGMEMEQPPRISLKPALERLNKLGLTPTGDAYSTIFLYGNMNQTPSRCGMISIPVD